jgi:PAS domain S-box-containing protein
LGLLVARRLIRDRRLRLPESLIDLAGLLVGAEDFLATVLRTAAQPIWVVDDDGVIRFANPAAIEALGYDSADELVGRHSHDTIHHSHADGTPYPAAECPMLLPRVTGETVSRDLDWFFRRDGSMFPVSYVSAPIEMREGRGAVVAFTDIEDRLRAERELRERDELLAGQQASLRRIAGLVAGGADSVDVFAAIAREVGQVIGLPMVAVWRYEPGPTATVIGEWSERAHPFRVGTRWPLDGPTVCAKVFDSGRPSRIEDFGEIPGTIAGAARETGVGSCAGAPIIVDGQIWGVMSADTFDGAPLAEGIEDRVAEFTELVATAISNSASREALVRLADEQAALRRVATLVARGVSPAEVFEAVAREAGQLLEVDAMHMGRYDDGAAFSVAGWSRAGNHLPVGTRVELDGTNVASLVLETGRPARLDGYSTATGTSAERLRHRMRVYSSVAVPVVTDGRLWGLMIASSSQSQPLPANTESRLLAFTEHVVTAISNTEARTEARRLTDEQAALRRVATLVAQREPSRELFGAVAEEAGRLLDADLAGMIRYEGDETVTAVAAWAAAGEHPDCPERWPTEEGDPATLVAKARGPVRIDEWEEIPGPIAAFVRDELGVRSSVGAPIFVEGRLWGALAVHSTRPDPLPADTAARVENFTDLVGTAIANAQARAEVARLADEQAALRRVATLVAHECPPEEVFAAVAEEVGRFLSVEATAMVRYDDDGAPTVVASWGKREDVGIGSTISCPIVVDGRLWGSMVARQDRGEPLPRESEARIGKFTELVATAISNVQARSDLAASRARIVAATDEERRRVVRDLHDGAQQRLVHTIVTLKLARDALGVGPDDGAGLVEEALDHAQQAISELRELSHGILPTILTHGGLHAAVEALASRTPVPVEATVCDDRLPAAVEATAYFVIAEALTNVAKHAHATSVTVSARIEGSALRLRVHDDGIGGARPDGSGLVGLTDRLAALDGQLRVESPEGGGTLVTAEIPLPHG